MTDYATLLFEETTKASCMRAKVGCILLDADGKVLSKGHNIGKCSGNDCPAYLDSKNSCHTIHAEQVAVARCHDLNKANIIMVTKIPCEKCRKLITDLGLFTIIIGD